MHGQRDDEQVLFLLVTEWPLFIWKPKEKNFGCADTQKIMTLHIFSQFGLR